MGKQTTATGARLLLQHLLTAPSLSDDLQTLHDLALYESGDALLCAEEKEALFKVKQLAALLAELKKKDYKWLRKCL